MKIRTIFLLFVLILMAVFLVINWTALSTVTAVNLIYTEIQAPRRSRRGRFRRGGLRAARLHGLAAGQRHA